MGCSPLLRSQQPWPLDAGLSREGSLLADQGITGSLIADGYEILHRNRVLPGNVCRLPGRILAPRIALPR
jgi:hypothetical protein